MGAQYNGEDDHWGVGASWRTNVDFTLKGKSSGRVVTAAAPTTETALPGTDATAANSFPTQINVGGYYDLVAANVRLIG